MTVRDVYVDGLRGADVQLARKDIVAIAGILRALGWTAGSKRIGKRVVWGWYHPGMASLDDIVCDL